jgi:hypothetical protein
LIYSTSCPCGEIKVVVDFPRPIEAYQARACDCDFCTSRGLAYLSDVDGTLSFSPIQKMNQLKQGSGQAIFWQCQNCLHIVAVTSESNGVVRGAIAKQIFEQNFQLKPSINVSPKTLSPSEKTKRWLTVWSKVV